MLIAPSLNDIAFLYGLLVTKIINGQNSIENFVIGFAFEEMTILKNQMKKSISYTNQET